MCPQPARLEPGMNFGVVFAVILSLPLARLEVSPIEGRLGGGGDRRGRWGACTEEQSGEG